MMLNLFIIVILQILFPDSLMGQVPCYDSSKVGMLLYYRETGKKLTFERFELLSRADSGFISTHRPEWMFFSGKADKFLDDAEFLRYIGMTREANLLRSEKEREIKQKGIQCIISLPIGLILGLAGGWWLAESRSSGSKEVLDYALSSTMILSGIGIVYAGISRYINAQKPNYTRHTITYIQALDKVDRYNRILNLKCSKE